jgi:hypothetical protein
VAGALRHSSEILLKLKITGTHFLEDYALLGYFAVSMDILGHPVSPILRVQESKRKPVAPLRVYVGKSVDDEKS